MNKEVLASALLIALQHIEPISPIDQRLRVVTTCFTPEQIKELKEAGWRQSSMGVYLIAPDIKDNNFKKDV